MCLKELLNTLKLDVCDHDALLCVNRETFIPAPDSGLYTRQSAQLLYLPIDPSCCPVLPQYPAQASGGTHCSKIWKWFLCICFCWTGPRVFHSVFWRHIKGELSFNIKVSLQVLVNTTAYVKNVFIIQFYLFSGNHPRCKWMLNLRLLLLNVNYATLESTHSNKRTERKILGWYLRL